MLKLNIPDEFWSVFAANENRNDYLECMIKLYEKYTQGLNLVKEEAKAYLDNELPDIDVTSKLRALREFKWYTEEYNSVDTVIAIPSYAIKITQTLIDIINDDKRTETKLFRDITFQLIGALQLSVNKNYRNFREDLQGLCRSADFLAENIVGLKDKFRQMIEEHMQKEDTKEYLRGILDSINAASEETDSDFTLIYDIYVKTLNKQLDDWYDLTTREEFESEAYNQYWDYILFGKMLLEKGETIRQRFEELKEEEQKLVRKARIKYEYIEMEKQRSAQISIDAIIAKTIKLLDGGVTYDELLDTAQDIYSMHSTPELITDKKLYSQKEDEDIEREDISSRAVVCHVDDGNNEEDEKFIQKVMQYEQEHTDINGKFRVSIEDIKTIDDAKFVPQMISQAINISTPGEVKDISLGKRGENIFLGMPEITWVRRKET